MLKMKAIGDYCNLYLKTEVLVLANVSEKTITVCLEYQGLDSCHYFSSPGLGSDAILKMAGVKLKFISVMDMYLFTGKDTRGGISYIAKRYSKDNSKYMKSYEDSKLSKFIIYLNANNLYGWAMSQYLPSSRFKWSIQKEINRFNVNAIRENNSHGYILDLHLENPDETH